MSNPEVLEDFPEGGAGRPQTYPWTEWADEKTRKLIKGEHYSCTSESFRSLVHSIAKTKNMKARTKITSDKQAIYVAFYSKDKDDK